MPRAANSPDALNTSVATETKMLNDGFHGWHIDKI
jgi:hypothetical protein